jgi:hypothetical protein
MRIRIILLCLSLSNLSFAQLREGFDPNEAKSLIAICNSYTFQDLYGSDTSIIPKDYQKVFTSEVIGMDNKFQVYENGLTGVICFRGSTANTSSWVENFYSAMIPAEGSMAINDNFRPYVFAKDTAAAVHSGYALATVLLSYTIIEQINHLNAKGIYHIIITGHSQGGALAQMVRAYLENLPEGTISSKNVFKTYAFASPMCGNKTFAIEYNFRYKETNMSYTIINPTDLVPQMPMPFKEEALTIDQDFIVDWIFGRETFDANDLLGLAIKKMEPALKNYIYSSNQIIEKFISFAYVSIDLPDYVNDIKYYQTGAIRKLEPFPYPKIEVDTTGMGEQELEELVIGEDGKYYKKEPSFFQHKPYNYYVAILKEYFSREYRALDRLYLPENL